MYIYSKSKKMLKIVFYLMGILWVLYGYRLMQIAE